MDLEITPRARVGFEGSGGRSGGGQEDFKKDDRRAGELGGTVDLKRSRSNVTSVQGRDWVKEEMRSWDNSVASSIESKERFVEKDRGIIMRKSAIKRAEGGR